MARAGSIPPPGPRLGPEWEFRFYDAHSGDFIDELPLDNVEFEWDLPPQIGDFTAYLRLNDPRARRKRWREACQERRTIIQIVYYGSYLGGGWFLWDVVEHGSNQTLELRGSETWSYWHHRCIEQEHVWVQTEQMNIVGDLMLDSWLALTTADVHNPGETYFPGQIGQFDWESAYATGALDQAKYPDRPTGRLRDRRYHDFEAKDVAQLVEQLSAVIDGFDFRLRTLPNSDGSPRIIFDWGYPRLGSPTPVVTYTHPGTITDWTIPRLGSQSYNRRAALGDDQTFRWAQDLEQLESGVPTLEHALVYSGITDPNVLYNHAQADLASSKNPAGVPTIDVRLDRPPRLGSMVVGDTLGIQIEDEVFYPGPPDSPDGLDHRLDVSYRLMGVHVRPDEQRASLILNSADTVLAREEAAQQQPVETTE